MLLHGKVMRRRIAMHAIISDEHCQSAKLLALAVSFSFFVGDIDDHALCWGG